MSISTTVKTMMNSSGSGGTQLLAAANCSAAAAALQDERLLRPLQQTRAAAEAYFSLLPIGNTTVDAPCSAAAAADGRSPSIFVTTAAKCPSAAAVCNSVLSAAVRKAAASTSPLSVRQQTQLHQQLQQVEAARKVAEPAVAETTIHSNPIENNIGSDRGKGSRSNCNDSSSSANSVDNSTRESSSNSCSVSNTDVKQEKTVSVEEADASTAPSVHMAVSGSGAASSIRTGGGAGGRSGAAAASGTLTGTAATGSGAAVGVGGSGSYSGGSAEEEEGDDEDEEEEEGERWISWFCALEGHDWFAEIDEEYIKDAFNLFGLKPLISRYDAALDMVLGPAPDDEDLDEQHFLDIYRDAMDLYGLIHARYIITPRGLPQMRDKYISGEFGECPRVLCDRHPVLPVGLSSDLRSHRLRVYCPLCQGAYEVREGSEEARDIDGAYFGPSFPHIFLQTFVNLVPLVVPVPYQPKIFGFRVHNRTSVIQLKLSRGEYGKDCIPASAKTLALSASRTELQQPQEQQQQPQEASKKGRVTAV